MFCKQCGKELDDGAEFCSYCGYNIKNGEAAKSAKGSSTGSSKPMSAQRAAAPNSNKILLIFAGVVLGVVLITIMIVVIIMANSSKGGSVLDIIDNANAAANDAYFSSPLSVNQTVEFGRYEQDGNPANGKEPIKWRVVAVENDRYLLYSQNVLDCIAWDDGSGAAGGGLTHGSEPKYDNSSMRSWMNDTFDAEAFNEEELGYIIPVSFRNGVITVEKDNQYAKDHSFIPSSDELFANINSSTLGWKTLAPPSRYALDKGVYTVPYETYTDAGIYGGKVVIAEENKRDQSYWLFGADNTDFFDNVGVALYHVRDTKEFGGVMSPCFVDTNGKVSPENVTDIRGIRPAIYLSKDACYTAPVQVNEKLGSAADKMPEYKGTYKDSKYADKSNTFAATLTVKQGFFELYLDLGSVADEELDFFNRTAKWNDYNSKYNLSDLTYEKDGSKDVFTDYNRGLRLVFDPGKQECTLYLKFVKGDFHVPDDKTGKWLSCINFTLVE